MTEVEEKINTALETIFKGDEIKITDYAGDQNHFFLEIKSDKFQGLSRIEQQKLVFRALGKLVNEIHAFRFQLS